MNTGKNPEIIFVCSDCDNTRILYNGIRNDIVISRIIVEGPVSKKLLVKRRIKRLGYLKVAGQLAFQAGIVPLIRKLTAPRVKKLLQEHKLDTSPMPEQLITRVPSVNDQSFIDELAKSSPDLVLVNGTRVISAKVLATVSCPIINVHVGITPLYRGVHGAYWALANNEAQNCGVTVHAIDKGIDTGGILAQDTIVPGPKDNFITYPYLQFEKAIDLVKKIIPQVLATGFKFLPSPVGKSKLYYHPTAWQYLRNRFKGVK
jgi:folate-dependent phosphoribosylglycinamide formyltransferase PurN